MAVPYYSTSQINMFSRCAEQYRRRYIEGERIPPGIEMIRGRAVHEGARVNFRQKLESRVDLPKDEIVGVAVSAFEAESQGDLFLSEEDAGRGIKAVIGEALDETVRYAKAHAELQAPEYQPALVEESIDIASGVPGKNLRGVLDLATEKDQLVDIKSKGKTPPQAEADRSLQLTVYDRLFVARMKRKPAKILQDVLVNLKGGVKRVVFETSRGERDFAALAARIETMDASINAGHFPPTNPDNWACSKNWCGYYRTCRYVNGGR